MRITNQGNTIVELGPDGTLNTLANVKAGKKGTDAVNVEQMTDAIAAAVGGVEATSVTYAELSDMATNGEVVPGIRYKITDRGGEGILVVGATPTTVSRQAILLALNADYQKVGDYSGVPSFVANIGVWRKSTQIVNYVIVHGVFEFGEIVSNGTGASGTVWKDDGSQMTVVGITGTFADADHITGATSGAEADVSGDGEDVFRPVINDVTIWNNTHYKNITGNNGSSSPDSDGTNWEALAVGLTTGYVRAADMIIYDFEDDAIVTRWDKNQNNVTGGVGNFPWGNDNLTQCMIIGPSNYMRNISSESVITDYISVGSGVGMIGFNGGIENFRAFVSNVDLTDAWMTIEGFSLDEASVNLKNNFVTLNNVQVRNASLISNFAHPAKANSSLNSVSVYDGATLNIGRMAGFISQSSFSNNCAVVAPVAQGFYLTYMDISVDVQLTLDGTGQNNGLTARRGYSNIIADVVPKGALVVTYNNHTGPAFADLALVINDVTNATATIFKHSTTALVLINVSGEWNDGDHFHTTASIAEADTNGDPENSALIPYDTLVGGPFTPGESLSDGVTSATAIVTFDDGVANLFVKQVTGLFKDNDDISGGASGTTAAVDGATTYLSIDLQAYAYAGIVRVTPPTSQEFIDVISNAQVYFPYRFYPTSGKLITFINSSNIHNINGDSLTYTGTDGDWIEYAPGNVPYENTHAIY